eukprot:1493144-Prymnesium_polylepis.1
MKKTTRSKARLAMANAIMSDDMLVRETVGSGDATVEPVNALAGLAGAGASRSKPGARGGAREAGTATAAASSGSGSD